MQDTNNGLGRLQGKPMSPRLDTEPFHCEKDSLNYNLLDFWRWASSDLFSNATRGVLAEFIVAKALDLSDGVRSAWDSYDLKTKEGYRVEVKSAAYIQSWNQTKPSAITFGIKPTRAWIEESIVTKEKAVRQSDVYVLCHFKHPFEDLANADPLNVTQWDFYIVPTWVFNDNYPEQKTIGISSVRSLESVLCVPYEKIDEAIKTIMIVDTSLYESLLQSYPIPSKANSTEDGLTMRQRAARKAWETMRKNKAKATNP